MKRALLLFLIVLLFVPSLACGSFVSSPSIRTTYIVGSGDLITQMFEVDNFERVTLEGFGSVHIEQGQTESLSVETDDNILPLLEIRVRGDDLILGVKRGYEVKPSRDIAFDLTVKDLSALELDGSGDFDVEPIKTSGLTISVNGSGNVNVGGLTADELAINLDGSGNIRVEDITVLTLDTSLQGSGDIELAGKANTQSIRVNGSGNYRAGDLETMSADIRIPGSANVTVWTTDELRVRLNGSGNVQYYGRPTIDQTISGSGNLSSLGEK